MEAVIIAGGKGTRLAKYTKEIPKPMIPVNGKPVLLYQIEVFRRYGITDIIMTVGYLRKVIQEYFGDGRRFGVNIHYVEEHEPLGSAGALYYVKNMVKDDFFVVYGDVLFDVDLDRMLAYHTSSGLEATILVHPNTHPYDSDLVIYDNAYRVSKFLNKNSDRKNLYYKNCVNAGLFAMKKSALASFSQLRKADLEKDLLHDLIKRKQVMAYRSSEYIKDMGTYERLEQVERNIAEGIVAAKNFGRPQNCIFFNGNMILNRQRGFLAHAEMLELEEGAAEAVRMINNSKYLVVVVTEQSAAAGVKGVSEEFKRTYRKLEMVLGRAGAYLDDIGFLEQAVHNFSIDLQQSWLIGGSLADIQIGRNAGVRTVLLQSGEGRKDSSGHDVKADYICENLNSAVAMILK